MKILCVFVLLLVLSTLSSKKTFKSASNSKNKSGSTSNYQSKSNSDAVTYGYASNQHYILPSLAVFNI